MLWWTGFQYGGDRQGAVVIVAIVALLSLVVALALVAIIQLGAIVLYLGDLKAYMRSKQ